MPEPTLTDPTLQVKLILGFAGLVCLMPGR